MKTDAQNVSTLLDKLQSEERIMSNHEIFESIKKLNIHTNENLGEVIKFPLILLGCESIDLCYKIKS